MPIEYCLVRKAKSGPILFDNHDEVKKFMKSVSVETGWHTSSLYKLEHIGDYTVSTNFIPSPKE